MIDSIVLWLFILFVMGVAGLALILVGLAVVNIVNRHVILGDEQAVDYHGSVESLIHTSEYQTLQAFRKGESLNVFEVLDAATAIKAVLDKKGTKSDLSLKLYQEALNVLDEIRAQVVSKMDDLLSRPSSITLLRSCDVPRHKLVPFIKLASQREEEVMYETR